KNVPPKKQQAGQAGQGQKQAAPKQQAAQNKQQTGKSVQPMAVNMPGGFSQNDLNLLANAVYGEARGEPYIGQVAIAAVILNRLNSPTF
ncbi:spore cortex-lytic enzyme, partial [Geobacillus sp. G4]